MGQQQLLLIVLGVIIVGVAIVAGIGLFNAGAEEAAKDELVSQCMAIAANAQQWYKKPVAMGGGGNSFVNWEVPAKLSSTSSCGTIQTDGTPDPANPGYVATGQSATGVTITATVNTNLDYDFTTVVCTVTPTNITTVVN